MISLDKEPITKNKSFKNLKFNINNNEISKDSIIEINTIKNTKIKRKTFPCKDSLNMRDKLKKVKQNYFNIGRLNNKSFVFNNENYENNIKEISLYLII